MENVLFLHSEIKDPYLFYARMRDTHPIYYDEYNKIWAAYTYSFCEQLLNATEAMVSPPVSLANKHQELHNIVDKLARLSNDANHTEARAAAMHLMASWKWVDQSILLHSLIGEPRLPAIDWVGEIAKRLPAFALLKGFDFSQHVAFSLLPEIENLTKLMAPVSNDEEVESILRSVRSVQDAFNAHFTKLPAAHHRDLYLANFIGLLIQSYDASRGLLSNALLTFVRLSNIRPTTQKGFNDFVRESTRLEPAVHNTLRTMQSDILIGNHEVKRGERILIVLASANRDSGKFFEADSFHVDRTDETLSFGAGIHKCIADNFSTHLTASLLHYLNTKYSKFEIHETEISYEPRINVRLAKKITLTMS